jgi:PilZ domain-containing protein
MVKMGDRPFQMFQTRDLSLDGAFVETGPHRIGPRDRIEVALKIPVSGTPQIYRFNAHVARVAPGGVGMVFDHANTESYAALLDLVFSTQPKGSY